MMRKPFTPEEIARQSLARLRAKADPKKAAGVQRYFKETVKSYGLSSGEVREMAAELFQSVNKDWGVVEAMKLCDVLYPEPELEAKGLATLILTRFKKDFPKTLFSRIKAWLAADLLANWASVDGLCSDVMGALILKYPELEEKIKSWTGHANRWVKRASAVSLIKLARKEKYADTVYAVSRSLFAVNDDLIQKANGWLLREAGKGDVRRLETFLLRHGPAVPRTTLRYAIERFGEKKRKTLLLETKKG